MWIFKKKIVATTTLLLLRSTVYLKKLQIFLQLDTLPCQNILKTSQSNGMNFIVPLQLKKLTFWLTNSMSCCRKHSIPKSYVPTTRKKNISGVHVMQILHSRNPLKIPHWHLSTALGKSVSTTEKNLTQQVRSLSLGGSTHSGACVPHVERMLEWSISSLQMFEIFMSIMSHWKTSLQEISNRTHWTNRCSNLLRGPLVRSPSIFVPGKHSVPYL